MLDVLIMALRVQDVATRQHIYSIERVERDLQQHKTEPEDHSLPAARSVISFIQANDLLQDKWGNRDA